VDGLDAIKGGIDFSKFASDTTDVAINGVLFNQALSSDIDQGVVGLYVSGSTSQ
jgi:hypothetical protein